MSDRMRGYRRSGLIAAAACGALAGGCANQRPPAPAAVRSAPHQEITRAGPQNPAAVPAAAQQPGTPSHSASPPPLASKLGADFGGAGGWVVGASAQQLSKNDKAQLEAANRNAEQRPASLADVASATTADLNHDGFITVDELLAMKRAGVPDSRIIERLRATGDAFAVAARQQQYLRDRGIDQKVIKAMLAMKQPEPAAATASARVPGSAPAGSPGR